MFYKELEEQKETKKKRRLKTWVLYIILIISIFSIIYLLDYFNIIYIYNNNILIDNVKVLHIIISILVYETIKKIFRELEKRC